MASKAATPGKVRGSIAAGIVCLMLTGYLLADYNTNFDHQWPRPITTADQVTAVLVVFLFFYAGGYFLTVTAPHWRRQLRNR